MNALAEMHLALREAGWEPPKLADDQFWNEALRDVERAISKGRLAER